jgi:hypothetical protein
MHEGTLLQALVGRWTWPALSTLYATPYELASGVHGQCTSGRFWCTRFLRGVTERVWLGPELVQQLGGTGALEAVAEVAPRGPGVRVTLREDASLDDLEAALAPLLPGERDWHEGVDRLYPRIRDAGAAPPEN